MAHIPLCKKNGMKTFTSLHIGATLKGKNLPLLSAVCFHSRDKCYSEGIQGKLKINITFHVFVVHVYKKFV